METTINAVKAMRKRIPTYEIGGKSRSPTLIASQVELQIRQSVSHAAGIRQSMRSIGSEVRADILQTLRCWGES
jgi:hypothetical protein